MYSDHISSCALTLTKTDVLHHWSGDGYANESSEYDHKLELHFEYVL